MIYITLDVEIKKTATAVASVYRSLLAAGLVCKDGETPEDLQGLAAYNQRVLEAYEPTAETVYCCSAKDLVLRSELLGEVWVSFTFQDSDSSYRCDIHTDEEQFEIWGKGENGSTCRIDLVRVRELERIAKAVWNNENVLIVQTAWEASDCSPRLQEIRDGVAPNVNPFCIVPCVCYEPHYGTIRERVSRNALLIEDTQTLYGEERFMNQEDKGIMNQEDKRSDQKEYIYCGVQFSHGGQTYSYRTEDESIAVGDTVYVPVSVGNGVNRATVVSVKRCTEQTAPYPPALTKKILGKTGEYGIEEWELTYRYRMQEVYTEQALAATCRLIEANVKTSSPPYRKQAAQEISFTKQYATEYGAITVKVNRHGQEGICVYTLQPIAFLEEACKSCRPPKKRLRVVNAGVWAEIEHAYDSACRALGRNGYDRSEEGRLAGWYHLLRAYYAAEQESDKDDVIYARILYLMLQACPEEAMERPSRFAIPMLQAYDRALADKRQLCEQEYDKAKTAYERAVYYEERRSNSGEAAWVSEMLINRSEKLEEFGGIWDSLATGFEYTGRSAVLQFEKAHQLMVMRFDGVIGVSVNTSDTWALVQEMSCYRHFDDPKRLIFDIGSYRIECTAVTIESVRRTWGRTRG